MLTHLLKTAVLKAAPPHTFLKLASMCLTWVYRWVYPGGELVCLWDGVCWCEAHHQCARLYKASSLVVQIWWDQFCLCSALASGTDRNRCAISRFKHVTMTDSLLPEAPRLWAAPHDWKRAWCSHGGFWTWLHNMEASSLMQKKAGELINRRTIWMSINKNRDIAGT